MMEKRIKQIGQICFWIGLVIETVLVMIDKSAYTNPYESRLFRLTFALFCVKILTTKYSKKEWICMIFFGIIAVISYLINSKDEVVRVVAFIAACKEIDLKKQLKVILGITSIGSGIIVAMAYLGILGSVTITANFGRGYAESGYLETRYCFGMGHPNAFHCMMLMITILILYLYTEKMKWYHFLLLLVSHVTIYLFTDSNTGVIVASAIILGTMLLKYIKPLQKSKIIYILGALLILSMVLFSAYGAKVGRSTWRMHELDKMLNGRFQYAYVVEDAHLENWTLFAKETNEEYFDTGFIRLFYWYGIIPGLIYVLMHFYLLYEGYKKNDYPLLVILVGFSIFMIMEAHLISYYILRNYIFVWMGYYWLLPFQSQKEIK